MLNAHCPPHVIYVNALLCKMLMLQIVTLHDDYQYHIAYLLIINFTEGVADSTDDDI